MPERNIPFGKPMVGEAEIAYRFTTPEALLADFWADVESWRES